MLPVHRKATLSLVIMYNESDWTAGWNHFMKGATVFFKPHYETTEDPDDSIVLNPGGLPLVRFRKNTHSLLGPPFSNCTKMFVLEFKNIRPKLSFNLSHQKPQPLKHFATYTKKQCMYECLIDQVELRCKCLPSFMPSKGNKGSKFYSQ